MKSRATELLRRLLDSGLFTADDIARELILSRAEVDAFVGDDVAMSLSHQLSLADFVIARTPRFARSGYALRGQVLAAMAFRGKDTEVHREPPTSWTPSSRRRFN